MYIALTICILATLAAQAYDSLQDLRSSNGYWL